MSKRHESYLSLIWTLAKTDFTLRYHGSVLGYVWAILKPLFIFGILYFVFSSLFNPRNNGNPNYAIELIVSIMLFNFFVEGTNAGMNSLLSKAQLITKIYVPRWTLITASTLNSALVFLMNLIVVAIFCVYKQFVPSFSGLLLLVLFCILTYALILSFAFIAAPLYVKFRDLQMIWEVITTGLFYATPIIYPLAMMPSWVQRLMLINPMGFIIHFAKEGFIHNHYLAWWQGVGFTLVIAALFGISMLVYRSMAKRIAEDI